LSADLRVCAYAVALAFVACFAFGLAPALHGTRGNIAASIRNETGRGNSLHLRSFLLAGQVAISVVLLAAAGPLVRGLQHAQHRELPSGRAGICQGDPGGRELYAGAARLSG
jgi:hypothetical protein